FFFFFQAEDGIRDKLVTGVQTCALPISSGRAKIASTIEIGMVITIARLITMLVSRQAPSSSSRAKYPLKTGMNAEPTAPPARIRSEERRVGKECRSRGWPG